MNRFLASWGSAGLLTVLLACPSWAQVTPAPGTTTSQPAGGNRGGNTGQQNTETQTQPRQNNERPLYVEGRVLTETGEPPSETVSLKLSCGARTLQVIRADLKGFFQFALGAGLQANSDFSAADEAPLASITSGINIPGGYSGFGYGDSSTLTGCEIRISVPGFHPVMGTITDPASLGTIDVGVLELRRIAVAAGASVSATSLLAPSNARKEFDQGVKDIRSNRLLQATQHLERAVGAYEKYAAAWNELGKLYAADRQPEKARQSYEKAIAADARFAPPYVGLAAIQVQDQNYEGAAASVAKAVELDPSILVGLAGYVHAVANYRLNRLDVAVEGALAAEKAPHQTIPQLHALLADIYLRKQDVSSAAAQIRAYLKEAPQGSFAAELKQKLEELDRSAANTRNSSGPAGRPQIAP